MSNSKSYLRTEKLQQNVNLLIKEQTEQIKNNFNKIATLEPYLTDIDVNSILNLEEAQD